jgi:beta-lactamase regulating signal transducer with metallopeptidase domain
MGPLAAAQYGFAPALASALLHSLWQNMLIAGAAALTLSAMGRASAAARHNMAMAFLAAMLLVPAGSFLALWRSPGGGLDVGLMWDRAVPQPGGAAEAFVQASSPMAAILVAAWLAGVGLMLARHIGGLRAIAAMERGPSEGLPPEWRRRVDELRAALGIARAVAVRLSAEVASPFAARLLRPMIWLPLSMLSRTPADQIEALLAHELAHIARRDWLWNGVQCVIEALLFYHPAAWWLGRRIRQEREHDCDDLAVAACGDAVALAEALASLECERHPSQRLILAAKGGSLMQRITRLLSVPPSRGRWGALALLGAIAVAGGLLVAQIGLAGGYLPDLQVTASTDGPLGPGDYRQIQANGLDKRRFYRESLDSGGRRSETYSENGKPHAIDGEVRRWLAAVGKMTTAPPPPQIPNMSASPEYQAFVATLAARPELAARLGTPAFPTGRPPNGNFHLDGVYGSADLRIEMVGPKGHSMAAVKADMANRAWTIRSVELR